MNTHLEDAELTDREKEALDAWDAKNALPYDAAFEEHLLAAWDRADEASLLTLEARDAAIAQQIAADAQIEEMSAVEGDLTARTSPSTVGAGTPVILTGWVQEALADEVRRRLERLVAARSGSSGIVDDSIDELRTRLLPQTAEDLSGLAASDDSPTVERRALTLLAMRICRRRLADELREHWRANLTSASFAMAVTVDGSASSRARQLLRAVLDAVGRLHDEERELIAEAIDTDLDTQAAPQTMSSADRARLRRARTRLAAELRMETPQL